jgi:hypothetical protein
VSAMFRSWRALAAIGIAVSFAGCGDLVTQGRSPSQLVILSLAAAPGANPDDLGGNLLSDVITNVQQTVNGAQVSSPTIFNDVGSVNFGLVLKDPGSDPAAPAAPGPLNVVTITRYRVVYRRADGRNTPGVDVPFPLDSAVTVTVTAEGASTGFEIVRSAAKLEAPLRALKDNPETISTIAEVTFYGQDQAGNDLSATGMIGINFANFADPD